MKNYFKRLWKALWDSTDIDEKAEAALKEAKSRISEMKKELDHHIRKTNKESEVIGAHVTETTQVNPLLGRTIYCPHCAHPNIVYSFAWSTIKCQNKECQDLIDKYDWLI